MKEIMKLKTEGDDYGVYYPTNRTITEKVNEIIDILSSLDKPLTNKEE